MHGASSDKASSAESCRDVMNGGFMMGDAQDRERSQGIIGSQSMSKDKDLSFVIIHSQNSELRYR